MNSWWEVLCSKHCGTRYLWRRFSYGMRSKQLRRTQRPSFPRQRYTFGQGEILDRHVWLYSGAIGDFSLIDDNSNPHKFKVMREYYQRLGIKCMDRPLYPDLNPIEHVRNEFQVALHSILSRQRVPKLGAMLMEEWTNLPLRSIRNLLGSMRRQSLAVRDSNGPHSRYILI